MTNPAAFINKGGRTDDTYIVSGWAKADATPQNESEAKKFDIRIRIKYSDSTVFWKEPFKFNYSVNDWQYTAGAFNLSNNKTTSETPVEIGVVVRYHQQANTAWFDNFQLIKDNAQSYMYDKDGNIISVADNAKKMSSMEYSNNDLVKYVDANGAAKGWNYTYEYDNGDKSKNKHNLTKATDQRGIESKYTYDVAGNATSLEIQKPGETPKLKSDVTYDAYGFASKITDQMGYESGFTYDGARQVR